MKKIITKISKPTLVIGVLVIALVIFTLGLTTTFSRASGRFNLPLSWILTPSGTSVDANNNGIIDNVDAGVPSGAIMMWSGTLATIPSGWQLCDGTNDTPDLRDRFVYGVNTSYGPGNDGDLGTTAGTITHSHSYSNLPQHNHTTCTISPNPHTHTYTKPSSTFGCGGDAERTSISYQSTNTGSTSLTLTLANSGTTGCSTDSSNNLPPYYKIAFVCKN